MKQNKLPRRILALLLMLTLLLAAALPVSGAAEDKAQTPAAESAAPAEPETAAQTETITIRSAEEFLDFAASCTLDAWSQDKRIVLRADIELGGEEFAPIATFGGTFDGQGHTIRGLHITEAVSPAALIGTLQPGGTVRNLRVEGAVSPGGDSASTGGLVGDN